MFYLFNKNNYTSSLTPSDDPLYLKVLMPSFTYVKKKKEKNILSFTFLKITPTQVKILQ